VLDLPRNPINVKRKEEGARTKTSRRKRGLTSGMASSNHNHIVSLLKTCRAFGGGGGGGDGSGEEAAAARRRRRRRAPGRRVEEAPEGGEGEEGCEAGGRLRRRTEAEQHGRR
jgi:hypothetical protein